MKRIIGIDPGMNGGIAWINVYSPTDKRFGVAKMPETDADLVELIDSLMSPAAVNGDEVVCYVEHVNTRPQQSAVAMWKFGKGYGIILGVLAALKVRREFVSPAKWQRHLKCLSKGDKTVTKKRAQELFPKVKITHAIADALLIAEYGRQVDK